MWSDRLLKVCFVLASTCVAAIAQEQVVPKVNVSNIRQVFHNGEHNAFTDLCRYKESFYLTFRSCPDGHGLHASSSIIVLRSADLLNWTKVNRFSVSKRDVRDPHFLDFKGKLHVLTGTWYCGDAATPKTDMNLHLGYGVSTSDGVHWSNPQMMEGTFGHYIWRAAAFGDKAYLCGRRIKEFAVGAGGDRSRFESVMLESEDGFVWQKRSLFQETVGNETAFLFEPDGSVLAIARRDAGPAEICRARPPYFQWQRTRLDRYIGGPLVARWGDRVLVGGRNMAERNNPYTSLCWLVNNELIEFAKLPSAGDNSYPGFVALDPTRGVASWYSSHEKDSHGKSITAIYMADLAIPN